VTEPGRPFPLVLAAPSGAGKTSLARELVRRNAQVVFSVSATTRPARGNEKPGVDYEFVEDAAFDAMLEAGELVEWATVHGRRYGTPARAISSALDGGDLVVLDIDVQGARQIREKFPDAVLVFILPPSADELGRRLERRASESVQQKIDRLRTARVELTTSGEFDYVVVNDDFDVALGTLEAIVRAERHRVSRDPGFVESRIAEIHARLDEMLGRSLT
jgi:guanylate kinase